MLRFGTQIAKISNRRKYPLYGIYLRSPSFLLTADAAVDTAALVFSEAVFTADDVFWYLQNSE